MSTRGRWITGSGLAVLMATAGCGEGATDPVPVLAAVQVVEGAEQVGSVGMPLDTIIVLRAVADDGSTMAGITLAFDVSGDGGVDPASATTGADGTAGVAWTLATVSGPDTMTVTPAGEDSAFAVITATGLADWPDTMALAAGDQQFERAGEPLPEPIRVRLIDEFGNPVVGVPVEFSATSGGGSIEPAEVETDLEGIASAEWTLGASLGEQTAEALVRDSVVFDLVDLPGSPVSFTATAVSFVLDAVSPDPTGVGDTLTLTGNGFGPDIGDNQVWIDGRTATIVEVGQTAVTVTVPSFGCTAVQARDVTIARSPDTASAQVVVEPVGLLGLVPGQRRLMDAGASCLQLPGSTTDSTPTLYLVGLTSTREWSAAGAFDVTGRDSTVDEIGTAGALTVLASPSSDDGLAHPSSPEQRLRDWERSFLTTSDFTSSLDAADTEFYGDVASGAVPGDDVPFRVPYVHTDPCNDYSTRVSTLVYTGPRVVVAIPEVPDLYLSTLLGSAIFESARDRIVAALEGPVWSEISGYVGDLGTVDTDLDSDGRATVVFTSALWGQDVPPVFSTSVDLLDRATCPSSDEGIFVYVTISPLDFSSLSAVLTSIDLLGQAMDSSPPRIAHQLTHVAQNVRRFSSGITRPLPGWVAEGHAELLVEVIGHALQGRSPGMDYGSSVVTADATATRWYLPLFERLAYYFGWDGGAGRVTGAPEQCSLYGFAGSGPCDPLAGPGAAWSFVRYISDRVGPGLAGGEAELSRAMTLVADTDELDALLGARSGVELGTLITDWAMTLYTDGRLGPAEAPELQLTSWDLAEIYGAMTAVQRLEPTEAGFQSFALQGSVAGGGTAYLAVRGAGGNGPIAIRVTDPLGNPLAAEMEPLLWVVRVR